MFLVFSGVWTFLVDAYPIYAASALAANTFARCMFAAAFPLFGDQSKSSHCCKIAFCSFRYRKFVNDDAVYKKLGYQWATSLLAFLTIAMMPFP
jgi:hypothetical protein